MNFWFDLPKASGAKYTSPMKKLLFLSFLSLSLLAACGGDDSEEEQSEENQVFYFTYKTADFEIRVPNDWEVETSFTSEFPEGLRVAFQNNLRESSFVANVTVLQENGETETSAFDVAQKKLNDHEATLIDYQLLTQEEITLQVGSSDITTYLNTFEGRSSTSGPLLEFMQTYLVKGSDTWVITASYLPTEDSFVVESMDTMLRSFSLN